VILALSPLAYAASRSRRRRTDGELRPAGMLVVEGLIVLAAVVLGIIVAVALVD